MSLRLEEYNLLKLCVVSHSQLEYADSKMYPIIPRYSMLKDMIKDIMHNPHYMEVCHEVDN